MSKLKDIHIGSEVEVQIKNDLESEYVAVASYIDGIRVSVAAANNGTKDLLEAILKDEEEHVDWPEAQLDQIRQMGIQTYLAEQLDQHADRTRVFIA